MDISFSSHKLENAGKKIAEATRLFGVAVGRKYIQRLLILRATDEFTQLYGHKALRLHPLKGDRQNQYSIVLTGNFRLIIEKVDEDRIKILEVEDYHGN